MIKKNLTIFFMAFFLTPGAWSDEIRLTNGTEYTGKIKSESADSIELHDVTGSVRKIPRSEIKSINYKPLARNGNYLVLGATLGTPGGLNLVFGYYFSSVSWQISGMNFGTLYGAQTNLGWKFYDSAAFTNSLIVAGGYSFIHSQEKGTANSEWLYAGAGYQLNWYGFYLELLLTGGRGTFQSPQFAGQIGYVYRFNK